MVLTAAELSAFRTRESTEAMKREAKVGSLIIEYKTVEGVQLQIEHERADPNLEIKKNGLVQAVKAVQKRGFHLPSIRFVLTNAEGVENVAFMGGAAGDREATVYLGPKIGIQNKKQQGAWVGGMGEKTKGERGLADQVYDGTHRWFGNPKLTARAMTVVVHELGHVLHELQNEQVFWKEHETATKSSAASFGLAALKVSQYASRAPCEFVAEVFAGVVCGKTYDDEVKQAYRNLGGPEVARFL